MQFTDSLEAHSKLDLQPNSNGVAIGITVATQKATKTNLKIIIAVSELTWHRNPEYKRLTRKADLLAA